MGGEAWCLELRAGMIPQEAIAETYITGQSDTNIPTGLLDEISKLVGRGVYRNDLTKPIYRQQINIRQLINMEAIHDD